MRKFFGWLLALALVGGAAVGGFYWLLEATDPHEERGASCVVTTPTGTYQLGADQTPHAAHAAGAAIQRQLPARAITIALATMMQESGMRNLDYGDRDSLGLYQQRPSQGWGSEAEVQDPVYATAKFYDSLVQVPGYQDLAITEAAQAVQRSGFPDAYAQHEKLSRAWASALAGYDGRSIDCYWPDTQSWRTATYAVAQLDFPTLLARDLGLHAQPTAAAGSGKSTVRAQYLLDGGALLPDDPSRGAWIAANWALLTAGQTAVIEVQVGAELWHRTKGWSATGESSATEEMSDAGDSTIGELAPGQVLVTVAPFPVN